MGFAIVGLAELWPHPKTLNPPEITKARQYRIRCVVPIVIRINSSPLRRPIKRPSCKDGSQAETGWRSGSPSRRSFRPIAIGTGLNLLELDKPPTRIKNCDMQRSILEFRTAVFGFQDLENIFQFIKFLSLNNLWGMTLFPSQRIAQGSLQ